MGAKRILVLAAALTLAVVVTAPQRVVATSEKGSPTQEQPAVKIEGVCKKVLEKTEWVAISTAGPDGPHVVGTWGDYMRFFGIGDTLIIPAGGMHRTEANLRLDPRIELLCGTRQVQGAVGPGAGCLIRGRAELQTAGPSFEAVKAKFPWARAALVVRVEKAEGLLQKKK